MPRTDGVSPTYPDMDPNQLAALPTDPGVYLFRDAENEVLYVGKAKDLRARVRSYFRNDPQRSVRLQELVRRAHRVETVVVGSEAEALILEANLIKEHRPRFNVQLRDDKRYPYIKVTVQEAYPQAFITRRLENDGARYFGPYTSVGPIRQALDELKRLHRIRTCRYDLVDESPARPCLDHHIGRCDAPCVGLQSQEEYRASVDALVRALEGDVAPTRKTMEARMARASGELRFEEAARCRDVLRGLDAMEREQRVQRVSGENQDILAVARDGPRATAVVLRIRRGVLLGWESQRFQDAQDEDDAGLLASFATRYYLGRGDAGSDDLPREILVPQEFEDREVLEGVLADRAGRRVRIHPPQRGTKRRLAELAVQNARHLLEEEVAGRTAESSGPRADEVVYALQDRLNLKVVPRLMACFDISHFQGADLVGSAVVFEGGEPRKSGYRHMRIQGEWRNDDYQSMAEVVLRFLRLRLREDLPVPELLLLDGGKGQLSVVRNALQDSEFADVELAALAKRDEEVFRPGRAEPIRIPRRDPALRLLQRMRDEAHRFAQRYGTKVRKARTLTSVLDEIPGVGPARRKALLNRFGSVKALRETPAAELARTPGISETLAARIQERLANGNGK